MIELKNVNKTFHTADQTIVALDGIDLTIEDGEIFGIIGLSGAGKSTLVRCINLLEKPTRGQVLVDGRDLMTLSRRELLRTRRSIGMIFQGFNLLEQRNVLKNICFPLELASVPRAKAERRACLTEQQRETAQLIGKRGWRCISEAPGHAVVRHSGTEMDYPCAGAERREALPQRGGLSRRTLGKGQALLLGRLCAEALGELFRAEIYDRMIGSKGIQLGAWVVYHRSHLIEFCVEHCRVYPERLAAAAYRR